ncbi:FRM4A-like protein [Mya arenaria]|uniref:FRM4A-like protein n=1 Tax=Mya arenaria TaxID=6604 RepID=A0ABY7G5H0_MYAAR|nr:FRM4A-like protein [Mya arenaria]
MSDSHQASKQDKCLTHVKRASRTNVGLTSSEQAGQMLDSRQAIKQDKFPLMSSHQAGQMSHSRQTSKQDKSPTHVKRASRTNVGLTSSEQAGQMSDSCQASKQDKCRTHAKRASKTNSHSCQATKKDKSLTHMTEGRKCQILLPDERRLDFLIQPKLLTYELLDIVSSHFKLKEKEYFGLAFQDETGHYNWLQQEKKILDHDLPRKQGTNLVIAFLVRYYVDSIIQLRDTATVVYYILSSICRYYVDSIIQLRDTATVVYYILSSICRYYVDSIIQLRDTATVVYYILSSICRYYVDSIIQLRDTATVVYYILSSICRYYVDSIIQLRDTATVVYYILSSICRYYVDSIIQLRDTATVVYYILSSICRYYVDSIIQLRDTATVVYYILSSICRYYVDSIIQLRDTATVELFYLCAKQQVFKGVIECDSETVFELAAHVLQATIGDYTDEERVIDYYKKIGGTARGLAIVKIKKTYLGGSESLFVWKTLENLYYRERKFSIEVHDPKRVVHTLSSFNLYEDAIREPLDETDELSEAISDPTTQVSVSRRTFGPGNVNVHAWFGATPQLTKCIWSMAVAQHQFYHERKASKLKAFNVRRSKMKTDFKS